MEYTPATPVDPVRANYPKIKSRIDAIEKALGEIRAMCESVNVRTCDSPATDKVLQFMAAPGGLLRLQWQIANRTGVKERTVAWVMNRLKHRGLVVRQADARWSDVGFWKLYEDLTGDARLDYRVLHEISFRAGDLKYADNLAHGMEDFPDVGGKERFAAALARLAAAGRITMLGTKVKTVSMDAKAAEDLPL